MRVREHATIGLGLAILAMLAPAAGAVLAPASYQDPTTNDRFYHGVATEGTEDSFEEDGLCFFVISTFTLELSLDPAHDAVDANTELELSAPQWTGEDRKTKTATAKPGDPARIEVTQTDTCEEFTVRAVHVDAPTVYTVRCEGTACLD